MQYNYYWYKVNISDISNKPFFYNSSEKYHNGPGGFIKQPIKGSIVK